MAATEQRDLYEVLGVARDSDADALRTAYRKLARKYHPDVNPGDAAAEEQFKAVSAAYAVLSDPEKRRNYDEFGHVSLESGFDAEAARKAREAFGARFGTAGADGSSEEFQFGDVDDLLGRLFGREQAGPRGGGGRRPFPVRGADFEAELELEFLEAALGGEKRLVLPGAGGASETLTVRIPPGVGDGGRIRIPGKGGAGHGGAPPGDLWARLRVRPHAVFRREGRDLVLELPITVSEAVAGAKVEIPTLDGRATVTVPAGTDSGRKLRLSGKGIPDPAGGPAGDLYAIVRIRVPRDLDDAGRKALEALEPFEPQEPRKELFS